MQEARSELLLPRSTRQEVSTLLRILDSDIVVDLSILSHIYSLNGFKLITMFS